jgi:CRISPR-associated protein Cas5d
MKVERVSYDVITPSSARAIFEAILWKPAIKWNITQIHVINPIKWISVRRNEVGKKISSPTAKQMSSAAGMKMGIFIEDERQQRAGLFLKDVRYCIHGYFDFIPINQRYQDKPSKDAIWAGNSEKLTNSNLDETPAKYASMFERRAKKGQCFHQPYFGCKEFACNFRLVENDDKHLEPINEDNDLGFMLYDMNFENKKEPQPQFFRAIMKDGKINTNRKEIEVLD